METQGSWTTINIGSIKSIKGVCYRVVNFARLAGARRVVVCDSMVVGLISSHLSSFVLFLLFLFLWYQRI